MLTKKDINEIFIRFQAHSAEPKIELNHTSPYTLLVAVILSAQSTDKGVNKATAELFKIIQDPKDMIALGEEGLKLHIRSIGLFNSKASNIVSMSRMLLQKFNGIVPDNLEDLQSLPGVGRKSANVILNSIFNKHTIAIDTHVFRIANRIGFCGTKTTLATEKALQKRIPEKFKLYAHHWLVLHGRYICKAKKPLCSICLIKDLCKYDKKI